MKLVDQVHAVLFVADRPVTLDELIAATETSLPEIRLALDELTELLDDGPIQVLSLVGGVQLSTRPEAVDVLTRFLRPARPRLTRSQMEVLAVVAYRQPVTIAEIDALRGVQSDSSLRTLLERRLVREVGRKKSPGRPLLYATSEQFLHSFNLNDLGELPPLEPVESLPLTT